MNELALFAGAGGGILGGHLLGWRTVCAVEWEPYPASVLAARQNDGLLSPFPIWDDVQTFDGKPWRGIVDVVSGGFPCQDISAAGKGAGIDGERSGMWKHMARVVGEVRPRYVFVENSPMLITRGLDRILGDLSSLGYDTRWFVMGAADVGAPHQRDRFWLVGYSNGERWHAGRHDHTKYDGGKFGTTDQDATSLADTAGNGRQQVSIRQFSPSSEPCFASDLSQQGRGAQLADTSSERLQAPEREELRRARWRQQRGAVAQRSWWRIEPDMGRVAHGVAARVDRLKAIGNGQVPLVAATAWNDLSDKR